MKPWEQLKPKPKNLGNFKREDKVKQTVDPLNDIIDYVEKDAKAFAKDPIGNLGRTAYDMTIGPFMQGSQGIDNLMHGKGNPVKNVLDVVLGLVDIPDQSGVANLAALGIAGLTKKKYGGLWKMFDEDVLPQAMHVANTKEFKEWFGPWDKGDPMQTSLALGDDGSPLLLWHGTPNRNEPILQFDRSMANGARSSEKEFGTWLTTNKNIADLYANSGSSKGRVDPYFLNIRDLAEFNGNNKYSREAKFGMRIPIGYKTAHGIDLMEAMAGKNNMAPSWVQKEGLLLKDVIEMEDINPAARQYHLSNYLGDAFLIFDGNENLIMHATENKFNPFKRK